jgi:hypothetical protein
MAATPQAHNKLNLSLSSRCASVQILIPGWILLRTHILIIHIYLVYGQLSMWACMWASVGTSTSTSIMHELISSWHALHVYIYIAIGDHHGSSLYHLRTVYNSWSMAWSCDACTYISSFICRCAACRKLKGIGGSNGTAAVHAMCYWWLYLIQQSDRVASFSRQRGRATTGSGTSIPLLVLI